MTAEVKSNRTSSMKIRDIECHPSMDLSTLIYEGMVKRHWENLEVSTSFSF